MLMLGKVKLNKVVLYKEAELDLDYRGITVIRGRNLNAVNARHKTNGAGKSLLTSALPNCWFSSHPVLASLGKRASGMKAGMLKEKGSSITTEFTLPEGELVVPYSITKFAKSAGGSIGFTVMRDGKDLKLTTLTKAESYIESLLPFTEEEFYTHSYLDARRPFLLRVGSPTQRAAFFSSMFHMDQYDFIKDRCHAMRAELGDDAIRVEELKRRASDLLKELSSIDEPKLRRTLEKAEALSRKLKKRTRTVYESLSDLKLWVANKDSLDKVMKQIDGALDEDTIDTELKTLRRAVKAIDKKIDLVLDYQAYVTDHAKWKVKAGKLRKQLGGDTRSIKELRDAISVVEDRKEQLTDKLRDLRREHADAQVAVDTIKIPKFSEKRAARLLDQYGSYDKAVKALDRDVENLATQSSTTERLMRMAGDLAKGKGDDCALCGSDVRHKHGDSIVKGLKRQLKKIAKRADQAILNFDTAEAARDAGDAEKRLRKHRKVLQKRAEQINDYTRELKKLPSIDAERELLVTRRTLDSLDEPKWKHEVPKGNRKVLQKKRAKLQKLIAVLQAVAPIANKLAEVVKKHRGKNIERLVSKMERRYKSLQRKMAKASEEVGRVEPMLRVWKQRTKEHERVAAEIAEKEDALRDAPVLDMLKSIYGSKGLKRKKMLEYADFMEGTMNRYADAIFHERFRFKFDIGPNSFDIVAVSGSGKKEQVRDVKVLSGAEGGAFAFLTLASLLFMLPSRQRTNICVLDEMDFGMDQEGRNMLINSFIPELSKIVPHIIVVTPLPDEYPGSRSFLATKEGNETKLVPVQGHH